MRSTLPAESFHVLVVDPDHHAAAKAADVLVRCGHWVRCASSAAAALAAVQAARFDILLIDADSFTAEGLKLLRQVRALYPIAALSLTTHHHLWLAGSRHSAPGFSGTLHKPVTRAGVVDALWQLPELSEREREIPIEGERGPSTYEAHS